jgi:DUF4097 and DUF4098 domain-containing protein YvlB
MRTTKGKLIFAIVILFTGLISFGCSDVIVDPEINSPGGIIDYKYKASEPFLYNVDLANHTTLRVEGINGEVNVHSVSGTNQITISGEKIVSADTYRDAYTSLANINIEVYESSNELFVKTKQHEFSDGRSYKVNYTISVPSNLNVFVKNVNGKIGGRVSVPINGTVDMKLQNGSIELEVPQSTSAEFSASLINGRISLQNLTLHNRIATSKSVQGSLGNGQGIIALRTTNGNINVSGF